MSPDFVEEQEQEEVEVPPPEGEGSSEDESSDGEDDMPLALLGNRNHANPRLAARCVPPQSMRICWQLWALASDFVGLAAIEFTL